MADGKRQETTHQYAPLRTPAGWSAAEKGLVAQLTEIFDDIYRRYGRLRLSDMQTEFRQRFEDTEGNALEVLKTTKGLTLAINNHRVAFDASGIRVMKGDGTVVFEQESDTGNLLITGILTALGGKLGGFRIDEDGLVKGKDVQILSSGTIRLGNLLLEKGENGASIRYMDDLIGQNVFSITSNIFEINPALFINGALHLSALETIDMPANLYADENGRIYRSTYVGQGDPEPPATAGPITLSVTPSQAGTGQTLTATVNISGLPAGGGVGVIVFRDGLFEHVVDGQMSVSFVPTRAGQYRFKAMYVDPVSHSMHEGWSNSVSVRSA